MLTDLKEKFKTYYIDLVNDRKQGALAALFSFSLLLPSFIYGFFLKLVLSCYQAGLFRSYKADCRVISVGNITWGGTGKTPLVQTLVNILKNKGKNPAVLIRGYGEDETCMLKAQFKDTPVLAGRDRANSAKLALKRYAADILILDDGFQHWRLKRDLDIVLVDATRPFGSKSLIPRGILREPLSSLRRADIFILTKANLVQAQQLELIKKRLHSYNLRAPVYQAIHRPRSLHSLVSNGTMDGQRSRKIELCTIKNEPVALLCAIASPESLIRTLELLGAQVILSFCFPDHYRYTREDLEKIENQCLKNQIKIIITTEKDTPKLHPLLSSMRLRTEIMALAIELEIINDEHSFFGYVTSGRDIRRPYSVLLLSDGRAGHLNQSKAVAGIIQKLRSPNAGVTTRIVEVEFKNRFCRFLLGVCAIFSNNNCRNCLKCLCFCLRKTCFNELIQVPADIIISAGSSLSSVNLFLSYLNKARTIVLMKPSFLSLGRFDLAIIPEHDRPALKDNVLVTRITPNLIDRHYLKEQAEALKNRLQASGFRLQANMPTIGLLLGGDTPKYRLTCELMNKIISQVKEAASNLNAQILITTSRRTCKIIEKMLREDLADFNLCRLLVIANENNIPEAVGGILGLSDIVVVSGESISMVSEAVSAERYVLTFLPEKKKRGITKQERFLVKLEKQNIVTIVTPSSLVREIKMIWQEKPEKTKINDREAIYQAVERLFCNSSAQRQ